jgi:amino acid transporter
MGFQFTFYYIASLAPLVGGNLAFGFFIYVVASVISILVYYVFVSIMPRSGGDYVFNSRTLNPLIGFIGNISLGIILLLFAAINRVTIETTALSTLFAYLGVTYNNGGMVQLASTISQPEWIIILGLVWIIGSSAFALRSTRFYLKVQNYMFIIVMIGALAMIAALALTTKSNFVNDFNLFASKYLNKRGDYYSTVITSASSSCWTIPSFSLISSFLIYPLLAVGAIWGDLRPDRRRDKEPKTLIPYRHTSRQLPLHRANRHNPTINIPRHRIQVHVCHRLFTL